MFCAPSLEARVWSPRLSKTKNPNEQLLCVSWSIKQSNKMCSLFFLCLLLPIGGSFNIYLILASLSMQWCWVGEEGSRNPRYLGLVMGTGSHNARNPKGEPEEKPWEIFHCQSITLTWVLRLCIWMLLRWHSNDERWHSNGDEKRPKSWRTQKRWMWESTIFLIYYLDRISPSACG